MYCSVTPAKSNPCQDLAVTALSYLTWQYFMYKSSGEGMESAHLLLDGLSLPGLMSKTAAAAGMHFGPRWNTLVNILRELTCVV